MNVAAVIDVTLENVSARLSASTNRSGVIIPFGAQLKALITRASAE
jgi:hypothetical protein